MNIYTRHSPPLQVHSGAFPTEAHSPYKMSAEEEDKFRLLLRGDESSRAAESEQVGRRLREADEYEVTKLY